MLIVFCFFSASVTHSQGHDSGIEVDSSKIYVNNNSDSDVKLTEDWYEKNNSLGQSFINAVWEKPIEKPSVGADVANGANGAYYNNNIMLSANKRTTPHSEYMEPKEGKMLPQNIDDKTKQSSKHNGQGLHSTEVSIKYIYKIT